MITNLMRPPRRQRILHPLHRSSHRRQRTTELQNPPAHTNRRDLPPRINVGHQRRSYRLNRRPGNLNPNPQVPHRRRHERCRCFRSFIAKRLHQVRVASAQRVLLEPQAAQHQPQVECTFDSWCGDIAQAAHRVAHEQAGVLGVEIQVAGDVVHAALDRPSVDADLTQAPVDTVADPGPQGFQARPQVLGAFQAPEGDIDQLSMTARQCRGEIAAQQHGPHLALGRLAELLVELCAELLDPFVERLVEQGEVFAQLQCHVALKLGEYLTLLNETLDERIEQFRTQLDEQFRKPAQRKVRAMLLSGYLTPALASSHGKLIDVTLWSLESAEDLRARLETLRAGIGDGIDRSLRKVSIDTGAIKGGMDNITRHLNLDAEDARLFVRDTMSRLRNVATPRVEGAFNLGLVLGSLWFQQDSLRRSYANLMKAFGDERPEAAAAFMSAAVGNLGVGVEVAGAAIQTVRPALMTNVYARGQVTSVGMGGRILQFGSALAAVATAVEGVQYALAAGRTHEVGDHEARNAYAWGAVVAGLSAGLGIVGSIGATTVLLVPLGFAVILGFVALAFAMRAKELESQPLELWARHSRWGLPVGHRRWTHSFDMDTAISALNAALLGLTAELDVTERVQRPGDKVSGRGGTLDYRIVLPGYCADTSRYEWALWAFRAREIPGQIIAGGKTGGTNGPLPAPTSWKWPRYEPETTAPVIHHHPESKTLEIRGSITFSGVLDFHALELEVSYWPDQSDESGLARLTVKEDKLQEWQGWGTL